MLNVEEILGQLRQLERQAELAPEKLAALEQLYENSAKTLSWSKPFLRQRNQFRIRHIRHMQIRRPRILFGGRSFDQLNFQSTPPLRQADTVFISYQKDPNSPRIIDVLDINPLFMTIKHLLARLPDGFMPDFWLNYQACTCRHLLPGHDEAPFPIIGNLCHMFMARNCQQLSNLFDFVLPLSEVLSDHLRKSIDPAKIIDIPFGLAWGHFSTIIPPGEDSKRDIDVLLSFSPNPGAGSYGDTRALVHRLFQEAKAKLGDTYRFVWPGSVDKRTYIHLLQRSRIVLNAVGINGPYNYRTNEAVAAGALLMQLEPDFITGPQHMEKILSPGEEYVSFRADDFLPKLEALLEDEPRRAEIARRGRARMEKDYSYDALYRRLFAELTPRLKENWRARRISPQQALFVRTAHQQQLLRGKGILQPGQISLSLEDFSQILNGDIGDPAAVLLPLYPRLADIMRQKIADRLLPDSQRGSTAQSRDWRVCQQLFQKIRKRSVVDIYNFLICSSQSGQSDLKNARLLLTNLTNRPPQLTQAEILRIQTVLHLPGLPRTAEHSICIRIFNLPVLINADPQVSNKAAIDYMRASLCELLAVTDTANRAHWQSQADAILASYPIEGPAPDYLAKHGPLAAE